jgi:hypothetical protein
MMAKRALLIFAATTLLVGCKNSSEVPKSSSAIRSVAAAANADRAAVSATPVQYNDPPTANVGLSVEQAYAAIPHRRTIWADSETTVPSDESAYLKVIFQVVDQAIAVRVAGLQNFSNQQFDSANVDAEFDRLITFAGSMPVPKALASYHKDILQALSSERQFFADWKSQGDRFPFAQQIAGHPGVQSASSAARAAYSELMAKYPRETQSNKDAFFDYHCALDFL